MATNLGEEVEAVPEEAEIRIETPAPHCRRNPRRKHRMPIRFR